MDENRLKTENDVLRAEFARVDNERLRLEKENAELRQLLEGSAIPELQAQVRDARRVIKGMVHAVVAPMSKSRKGKALIDANVRLFNEAVVEIQLLGEGSIASN